VLGFDTAVVGDGTDVTLMGSLWSDASSEVIEGGATDRRSASIRGFSVPELQLPAINGITIARNQNGLR
jgi:hypothetical protein